MATEFPHVFFRLSDAEFFEASGFRFGERVPASIAKRERHGRIAVRFGSFTLQNRTRARFDHGDRHVPPVRGKYARHPDLAADDVFHLRSTPPGV